MRCAMRSIQNSNDGARFDPSALRIERRGRLLEPGPIRFRMDPMTEPLVSVRNLRVRFRVDRETTFEAVKGISFDIPVNRTIALVGESGSGKSVTSLSILGLLPKENSSVAPESRVICGGR